MDFGRALQGAQVAVLAGSLFDAKPEYCKDPKP